MLFTFRLDGTGVTDLKWYPGNDGLLLAANAVGKFFVKYNRLFLFFFFCHKLPLSVFFFLLHVMPDILRIPRFIFYLLFILDHVLNIFILF